MCPTGVENEGVNVAEISSLTIVKNELCWIKEIIVQLIMYSVNPSTIAIISHGPPNTARIGNEERSMGKGS